MAKKQLKVGVQKGSGPPPGYVWSVYVLDLARKEAEKLFTKVQYQHLKMQVQVLAREESPSHSLTASVDAIEDFHELRDKGGVLANLNARVFFGIDKGLLTRIRGEGMVLRR